MNQKNREPLVSDIKYCSMDDGPGIRTTVFMKGCRLNCVWCHNPETISSAPEIAFYPDRCVGCENCVDVCPEQAVSMEDLFRIDRNTCTVCGECVKVCPSTALRMMGDKYSVKELAEVLLRDRIFYETSNGGVTFSGGEPTLHMEYVGEAMKTLKEKNIRIAIQTSGMFDLTKFKEILLPWIDLIFYDLKIFNSDQHKKYTGRDNQRILDNFIELMTLNHIEITPRLPLIPGITDTQENLSQITHFLQQTKAPDCKYLPYNSSADKKRAALGLVSFE